MLGEVRKLITTDQAIEQGYEYIMTNHDQSVTPIECIDELIEIHMYCMDEDEYEEFKQDVFTWEECSLGIHICSKDPERHIHDENTCKFEYCNGDGEIYLMEQEVNCIQEVIKFIQGISND